MLSPVPLRLSDEVLWLLADAVAKRRWKALFW